MRRFAWAVIAVTAIGCGSKREDKGEAAAAPATTATVAPATPAAPAAPKVDPKLISRGAYVAQVAGCTSCHLGVGPKGPDPTRSLSGGLAVPESIGTWRPGNITQDKDTGIGAWTDPQIEAAIREGTLPDGTQMYPVMPSSFFNRMTDDDLHALVAFLRSLPAVPNKVPPNDLRLPRMSLSKPANLPDDVTDPVKHGEYLATLMHCASCHTPFGPRGPDLTRPFAGGMAFDLPMLGKGTLYAANITSDRDTGIGAWTEQNIIDAVTKLTRPDGTAVNGPMVLYVVAWANLTDDDAKALAAYVKTIAGVKNKVPASTFKPL